jgi:SAM-dependent methyltransferase
MSTKTRNVKDYFETGDDPWEVRYRKNKVEATMYRDRMEAARRLVRENLEPGSLVLEVGCGTGHLSANLQGDGYRVVSTDIALRMAAQTRELTGSPRSLVADIQSPPFKPGSFDAVVLIGVISYVNDAKAVLATLHSLLKDDGVMVISSANTSLLYPSIGRKLSEPFYRLGVSKPAPPVNRGFLDKTCTYYRAPDFNALVCDSGFRLLDSRNIGFGRFKILQKSVLPATLDILLARIASAASRVSPFRILGRYAFANVACFKATPSPR